MKIKEIYQFAIKKGVEKDFRSKEDIENMLFRVNKKYEALSNEKKELFDKERLTNPFSDTRILYGDPEKEVKKVMIGIDIDGEELLLAKQLQDIDLVISHHPRGIALAGLDDVMQLQIDVLHMYGVPVNIAEKLSKKRIGEVARGLSPINHNRTVDMAKALDIPFMCIHTPADNCVARFIEEKFEKENPYFVKDIMDSLLTVYEYKQAKKMGAGPKIFVGGEENRVGKIVISEVTGGTEGSPEIYQKLADAGAGTIIGMHISEKHKEKAEKACINVVIAGHMSSDSIGVNLLFNEIEKKGVEIFPCGGLIKE
ncbi:MAG: NGG1p interacting factor NIF3 [Patescibacteria group bacterium]|nr:NGG1p interacting factor NIF3 [Patescibacteria group bacterium]